MSWQINLEPDDDTVRSLLSQDRRWTAYAYGDLVPPYRARSLFLLARRDAEWAILLIYRTTTFSAIQPFGPADGIAALFAAAPSLPRSCIISNFTGDQEPVIEQWYGLSKQCMMYRMAATLETFIPFAGDSEELGPQDIGEISTFYKINDLPTFSPDQVDNGVYRCVRRFGMLMAVGGTHMIAPDERLAILGNIYTDPMARGQGYARVITSAITQILLERGCSDVVLNVDKNNVHAVQVYERLGFVRHGMFWEAHAQLNAAPAS